MIDDEVGTGVWCSRCYGDHYTADCPTKVNPDGKPIDYGTCSVCREAVPLCAECGHSKASHIAKFGGICVGCPCPGYSPAEDHIPDFGLSK